MPDDRPPRLLPELFGFRKLLLPPRNGDAPGGSEGEKNGVPFGSTLLLSVPPGAGKTTFAFSLARALMKEAEKAHTADSERKTYILYYISSETGIRRLQKTFERMGWFIQGKGQAKRLFRIDTDEPDNDTFYTVVPEPEVDRPVPSPEELVNSVFSRIAKSLSPSEAPREERYFIAMVDSVTALLKGCVSESEERRQTHEILHRLRTMFGENLALTMLLAEQELVTVPDKRTACVEDYLADIVFRLYQKSEPLA